ncbi:MAG: adenylyltransferase/cytidyltransferase family protein [bacterium]
MRGLVVGRFQPLHIGHVHLIQQAREQCGTVVIAVGSTNAKPNARNPFSFEERKAMLQAVFPGVPVFAVPDIHDREAWVAHLLAITGAVDRVYGNDDNSQSLFEAAHVDVARPGLERRDEWEGTAIRRLMAEDDPAWRKHVPPAVAALLLDWHAPERIRAMAG